MTMSPPTEHHLADRQRRHHNPKDVRVELTGIWREARLLEFDVERRMRASHGDALAFNCGVAGRLSRIHLRLLRLRPTIYRLTSAEHTKDSQPI